MANKTTGRARPMAPKAGITKDGKRRYCAGGRLFSKGGKIAKKK